MDGYFLTADLLGFSNIVTNSSEDELSERIGDWVTLVETAAHACNVQNIQLISDTVFASADSTTAGCSSLAAFARRLLNDGVLKSLPVRGAITYGTFEWPQN